MHVSTDYVPKNPAVLMQEGPRTYDLHLSNILKDSQNFHHAYPLGLCDKRNFAGLFIFLRYQLRYFSPGPS